MPFARPTPEDLRNRIGSDILGRLGAEGSPTRASLESVLARMSAIAAHELHGHLAWIARQVLVDQADDEELDRHAGIWGIARRAPVTARGLVTLTGIAGTTCAADTELRRSDDVRYLTDAPVTIGGGGTVSVAVTASTAGRAGNGSIGTALTIIAPIAGLQSQALVIDDGSGAGLAGGDEEETDASLRARILTRIQRPPQGGADYDYAAWVRDVVGDTKVWVFPNQLGLGTVTVAFVMPDGSVPGGTLVTSVQDHLDEMRPVTAEVTVIAPVVDPLAVSIRLVPDTAATRLAVEAALRTAILRDAAPGGTLALSRLIAEMSTATGEYSHVLITPSADVISATGHIARLGTITWVV